MLGDSFSIVQREVVVCVRPQPESDGSGHLVRLDGRQVLSRLIRSPCRRRPGSMLYIIA